MNRFTEIKKLVRSGDLLAAFNKLEAVQWAGEERLHARTERASLLERLGRLGQSRSVALSVLETKNIAPATRAKCELILGRIEREGGATTDAIERLQKASALAELSNDLECFCWANMILMVIVSQRCGFEAAMPLLNRARTAATRLGDPQLTAALHMYVGQIEARRGFLNRAARHAALALEILMADPNTAIEAMIHNTRLGVAILRSEFETARQSGDLAVIAATTSRFAASLRASLGNMGNLCYATGDFDKAIDYFERAIATLPSEGESTNANLDGIAQVRLTQGRIADCALALDRIQASIQSDDDWHLYGNRSAALTRARLFAQQGEYSAARAQIAFVLKLADRAGDQMLRNAALLTKAELVSESFDFGEISQALDDVGRSLSDAPPDVYADYEASIACSLVQSGQRESADWHARRALQFHEQIGNIRGRTDAARRLERVCRTTSAPSQPECRQTAASVIQGVAAAFAQVSCARVAAMSFIDAIREIPSIRYAVVQRRSDLDQVEPIAHIGDAISSMDWSETERRFVIDATSENEVIECVVRSANDVESTVTLNAVELLIQALREAKRSRMEREKREALWSQDEIELNPQQAIVTGYMRGLMSLAQRVARTPVTVLIDGESGTGKEIVARAIHDFSDRANKPFVPINCAAVPRHLLESTMFGHRRGAFTGADRDSPGMIRAAREGTVFLDEIGELGLNLQPKLLRFLESGEISPLGDPNATIVNVRIVAATNRNLSDLVQEGRFREDLFYRLNVIRLTVKPLRERRDEIPGLVNHFVARAAKEFNKGYIPVAEETMERLLLYRWPGNVRQLQNEIRRMVALVEPGATIEPHLIADDILAALPLLRPPNRTQEIVVPLHDKLPAAVARLEKEMIRTALREHHGRVDEVAKALGISRKGLYLKRQRLGL
jgi:transcriptional regulator with PAS, ATPase and Fis domain/tetratricopeptide (TPR) repeat protein